MARDTTDVMVLIPTVKEWDVEEVECFFNFDSPVKTIQILQTSIRIFRDICKTKIRSLWYNNID
jgi:hypothetical protein